MDSDEEFGLVRQPTILGSATKRTSDTRNLFLIDEAKSNENSIDAKPINLNL